MDKENVTIKGVPVSGGIGMGEAQVLRDPLLQVVRRVVVASKLKHEISRLNEASEITIAELNTARSKAVKAIGEHAANIFDAQILIASDKRFLETVAQRITTDKINAEFAYQETLSDTLKSLEGSRDPYMRQMVYDIRSVSERVLSILLGVSKQDDLGFQNPTILIGRIFSPGQIMSFAKKNLAGLLTLEGGPTSHMGLIARSLGIPAVTGKWNNGEGITTGSHLIIDGNNGEIILNPDDETWRSFRRIRLRKRSQPFAVLAGTKKIDPVCTDGRQVTLAANLELPGPLDAHLSRLGVGVGLFRTEFLYFSKQSFPDEEEQFQVYSQIAKQFYPQNVILRTFDLGGDKFASEFGNVVEENPALGWRGLRILLETPKLFKNQLRAMLRASAKGNLRILLPMVSDETEVVATLDLIEKIKRELRRSRISFDEGIEVGIMIEVPAAAMSADYLAEKVDFFSIGTNDLIQYTMAADRGNYRVTNYYIGHHPAVLKLIQRTVHAAHDIGIPVSVCGEMAGSRTMAPFFVGLGVDVLSMAPTQLPAMAEWISRMSYIDAKRFTSRLLRMPTAYQVARALAEAYDYIKSQKKGTWLK